MQTTLHRAIVGLPERIRPMPSTISQISRRVENLDRARSFWRDTLQVPELYTYPSLAFFDLGGTRLMLTETGRQEEADFLCLAPPSSRRPTPHSWNGAPG
jgi:catechol 2,3-dioxygenase-like lactoylglutathione lyase family enzyme